MNKVQRLLSEKIEECIKSVDDTLRSCTDCASDGDYAQAFVRLEMLGFKFTELETQIADLESKSNE